MWPFPAAFGRLVYLGRRKNPAGFAVKYDGKIVYTYVGEWSRLKPAVMYGPEVNTKSIFFGCATTNKFKITQAMVTFPKE